MSMPLTHQYPIRSGTDCGNVLFWLCWWAAVEPGGLGDWQLLTISACHERLLSTDSVEKVGISGWKKATLALVSEPGHHVAWLSSSALTVAAWLIG